MPNLKGLHGLPAPGISRSAENRQTGLIPAADPAVRQSGIA